MADAHGHPIDEAPEPQQPTPGSGTPMAAYDGRNYWRLRCLAAEDRIRELEALLIELRAIEEGQ
jgi:hypothetical protein